MMETGMSDPMNANEMFDYAMGQVEGPDHDQAEAWLAANPRAAETVDRLSRALTQLIDDGETYEPPADLVLRTVRFALEQPSTQRRRTILDFVPATVPFRWADVAVAAGIVIAGLLTLMPAVQRSRDRMNQAGCAYNLQQLGQSLWQYANQHNHYPTANELKPGVPAGGFVSILRDASLFSDRDLRALDCPENGPMVNHPPVPDIETIHQLHQFDPQRLREAILMDYAYTIGHVRDSGGVAPIDANPSSVLPLLADQPPHSNFRQIGQGNSPNHRGRGQNVLYTDLHVGWHASRRLSPRDDDLYLNARHELAPGISPEDSVLVPSFVPFTGYSRP